jgi:hypothetical protein
MGKLCAILCELRLLKPFWSNYCLYGLHFMYLRSPINVHRTGDILLETYATRDITCAEESFTAAIEVLDVSL